MSEIHQLPFLLRLLDDPSPVVCAEVDRALERMADQLNPALDGLAIGPSQRLAIHQRLYGWRCRDLKRHWLSWWDEPHPALRLERAHTLLSRFLMGFLDSAQLGPQLDALADQYQQQGGPAEAGSLAHFLFSQRLRGDAVDYYHPSNSSLLHVLQRGRGNPISLCSLFILVGHRVDLQIQGCNFPSNFLARSGRRFYDCFSGGRALDESLGDQLEGDLSLTQVREVLERPCSVPDLMIRVLRNLVGAHLRCEAREEANLFGYLLLDLQSRKEGDPAGPLLPEPCFQPGQLVRHRTRGYRGVVVHYMLRPDCPRYHLLIHRSSEPGQADETELQDDASGPVAHNLVNYFFSKFEGGIYYRNGRPWEG